MLLNVKKVLCYSLFSMLMLQGEISLSAVSSLFHHKDCVASNNFCNYNTFGSPTSGSLGITTYYMGLLISNNFTYKFFYRREVTSLDGKLIMIENSDFTGVSMYNAAWTSTIYYSPNLKDLENNKLISATIVAPTVADAVNGSNWSISISEISPNIYRDECYTYTIYENGNYKTVQYCNKVFVSAGYNISGSFNTDQNSKIKHHAYGSSCSYGYSYYLFCDRHTAAGYLVGGEPFKSAYKIETNSEIMPYSSKIGVL